MQGPSLVPLCRSVKEIESVEYIQKLLKETSHNGFPVVQGGLDHVEMMHQSRNGPLQGVILRSQLLVLLHSKVRAYTIQVIDLGH